MKEILFVVLVIAIFIFPSCSASPKPFSDINPEDIEMSAIEDEIELEEELTIKGEEEYIKESESYRTQVEVMHNIITLHYSNLVDEYNKQKTSYEVEAWTNFLHNWNNRLKYYKKDLDAYKVNGHTYNLFYARNQISSAATSISAIWLYYANILDNKNVDEAQDNIEYFDKEIKNHLKKQKQHLMMGVKFKRLGHRLTMLLRFRACLWVFLPTPFHRAASAAKGKGFAGPVRRRRKTGTLAETMN